MANETSPASSQGTDDRSESRVSRRDALKTSLAAAVGGGASVLAGDPELLLQPDTDVLENVCTENQKLRVQ